VRRLPGLAGLTKSRLNRSQLRSAWQHGLTGSPTGLVHAPSLLAPLSSRGANGRQVAVTLHDAVAWTQSDLLSPGEAAWQDAMARRAERYADAVVVPTHAVADAVRERFSFGDRVRVIGGAVSPRLTVPEDADQRSSALHLPDRYVVAFGSVAPRKGLDVVLRALGLLADDALPLVLVGVRESDRARIEVAARVAGVASGGVLALAELEDADYAVVLGRAVALLSPSSDEGFGLAVLEALSLGTPVIHSDAPALAEVAGGAGLVVPIAEGPDGVAEAIEAVATDEALAASLSVRGIDRAGLFSWRTSAEKVWQLHADL
jgi:glycosyltransferase involved in cell wall biosynthesis